MRNIVFHPAVEKDLRKIGRKDRLRLYDEIFPGLSSSKLKGAQLTGVLSDLFKYRLNLGGVSYRIIYQVLPKKELLVIIAIGARSNIYQKVTRRIN